MTALDILKKHLKSNKIIWTQKEALSAMREIVEITWDLGKNWADHEPSNIDSPNPYPDLHDLMNQLFPES